MALTVKEKRGGSLLEIYATGKLTKKDYDQFIPELERRIKEHGKIDLLFEMSDFHGWEAGALWEDLKFDARHYSDLGRIAFVGEQRWQEWMARICSPFTTAELKYFDMGAADKAQAWLESAPVMETPKT